MERIAIEGGHKLQGSVRVHGAKNAALPILAASVMAHGESIIEDVPNLQDIRVMVTILRHLGAKVHHEGSRLRVDATTLTHTEVPENLMRQMRSSIFLMGPILARCGQVRISLPGGCTIGSRPIDLHLKGLQALGARIEEKHGYILCTANRLRGANIYLDLPSVGATENLIMAAVFADGVTTIHNAAREPEIIDLANYLNTMGARVHGAGEDKVVIEGVHRLRGAEYKVIPDRIVTGTLLLAAAITQGEIELTNVQPDHLGAVISKLQETGVEVRVESNRLHVRTNARPKRIERIQTAYYPGFPTDLQSPFMAFLSVADGTSVVTESIFEGRYQHVSELMRMGAKIKVDMRTAFIEGVPELTGAHVEATDLRAGAALILAGLAANGKTFIEKVHHIDRGYEKVEEVFGSLGAKIWRERSDSTS
ncbi:UDP-N-acetylglucosamine 1-carboxyvinyltransferase [Tumebacillus permanentifrigoris]|uniref:UDP-N-acetylglucosamine 1-carboxyvinyltransferase n=1 Tax=Tumebacillus permanentifrigoris TaxID=378543 RepID=A0A316D7D0_9BACL|nr:UDP-N-acetylglucosamine 1-carboxyvinyltransferase [Tumebacillus permanentifrigoris]PWK11634.1 UDP-N-acetylglucosamine 1-carboxyvinyltransferase [Tumebacillus permanentifrigoris]